MLKAILDFSRNRNKKYRKQTKQKRAVQNYSTVHYKKECFLENTFYCFYCSRLIKVPTSNVKEHIRSGLKQDVCTSYSLASLVIVGHHSSFPNIVTIRNGHSRVIFCIAVAIQDWQIYFRIIISSLVCKGENFNHFKLLTRAAVMHLSGSQETVYFWSQLKHLCRKGKSHLFCSWNVHSH